LQAFSKETVNIVIVNGTSAPDASATSSMLVSQARAASTSIGGSHNEGDSVVQTSSPPKSLTTLACGAATVVAVQKMKRFIIIVFKTMKQREQSLEITFRHRRFQNTLGMFVRRLLEGHFVIRR
jgi:hypothetical protein